MTGAGVGPSPETTVLVGHPATQIVALAQRERAQLIVMATRGLTGYRKMLVGSTTEQVLRHATVPVLIAPPSDQGLPGANSVMTGIGRVLVPVDFKDESGRDLRAGADIAQTLGVPLLVLHVVAPIKGLERLRPHIDVHNRAQFELAEREVQRLTSTIRQSMGIESVVATGSPAEEIAKTAAAQDVGLIVMGLRRQQHFLGARPGSIAYRVLGLAPALILALPAGDVDVGWMGDRSHCSRRPLWCRRRRSAQGDRENVNRGVTV